MEEEEKAPKWAERLINRVDELEKKLEKKGREAVVCGLEGRTGFECRDTRATNQRRKEAD